jgi:hypothetical protein
MHCTLLQIVAMLCIDRGLDYSETPSLLNFGSDAQFAVLLVGDYEADWSLGARGGADYWAAAEAMSKRRRSESLL